MNVPNTDYRHTNVTVLSNSILKYKKKYLNNILPVEYKYLLLDYYVIYFVVIMYLQYARIWKVFDFQENMENK